MEKFVNYKMNILYQKEIFFRKPLQYVDIKIFQRNGQIRSFRNYEKWYVSDSFDRYDHMHLEFSRLEHIELNSKYFDLVWKQL